MEESGDMEALLVQLGVATVPALVAYLGVRATNRTARRNAHGPEWAQYAEALREDVDAYRRQVTGLGERVESLEGDVRSLRVKYSGALGYIGVLQGYVPAESEPPAPPVSIRDDLQD